PEGIGEQGLGEPYVARNTRKTVLTLLATVPVIILTSMGVLHSSVGFGLSALILISVGIMQADKAYRALTMPVLVFIGSMIGITAALQKTGALDTLVSRIAPLLQGLPPLLVIWLILALTVVWANILGNTVAAVLMAPLVVSLAGTGLLGVTPDSLLMAVAAGASLGLVLPTHQATMVTQSHMHFSNKSFMKYGFVIALVAGVTASLVIYAVWL
ncbi:MAG TPA: SLC13 family permease, partial [Bacillota bacterium]|nr:SLC13 family permease [Bacillota bacterium]